MELHVMKKSIFRLVKEIETHQLAIPMQIIVEQQALLRIVKTALPNEIAGHVLHCVHSGSCLLVYTQSANWASKIRYFSVDILNKIIESGQQNINKVQIRLGQPIEFGRQRSANLPSSETVRFLTDQLKSANNDDVLKMALNKLASTLDKRLNAKN
jgi:hypothetical protein